MTKNHTQPDPSAGHQTEALLVWRRLRDEGKGATFHTERPKLAPEEQLTKGCWMPWERAVVAERVSYAALIFDAMLQDESFDEEVVTEFHDACAEALEIANRFLKARGIDLLDEL